MSAIRKCWCGNSNLNYFSPEYSICHECNTLVSQCGLSIEQAVVENDQEDFYGKEYWFLHMEKLGNPNIYKRSRQDLHERCLYWLRTILEYKLPPAKVIELGCGHGGLVALMKWAGFNAVGLEMSPWVVSFAHEAFDIPMLLGRIEDQKFQFEEVDKFDVIILNDVLEHLPDPIGTMQYCASLLKEDGIFVIQMPLYNENRTYEEMTKSNDNFLAQMKSDEHVYLFSKSSAKQFLNLIGFDFIEFEKPIFFIYDMYFIASRKNIVKNTQEEISESLSSHPSGRLIQALIDQSKLFQFIHNGLEESLEQTKLQLQQTEFNLEQTKLQLQQTEFNLEQTKLQLQQTEFNLEQTKLQLQQTHSYLQQTIQGIDEMGVPTL